PYNRLTLLRNRCKITPGKYLIVKLIVDEGGDGTEEKYFVASCEFLFQVENLSLCMIRVYKNLKTTVTQDRSRNTKFPPYYNHGQQLENDEDIFMVISVSQIKAVASTLSSSFDQHTYFVWNTSTCSRKPLGNFNHIYLP
ncbi:hypothetical protein CU098_010759, partial [Rhizopus stolonifer]